MVRSVLCGLTSDFPLNLLPLDFHSWGILLPIAIMEYKKQNNLLEIEWSIQDVALFRLQMSNGFLRLAFLWLQFNTGLLKFGGLDTAAILMVYCGCYG